MLSGWYFTWCLACFVAGRDLYTNRLRHNLKVGLIFYVLYTIFLYIIHSGYIQKPARPKYSIVQSNKTVSAKRILLALRIRIVLFNRRQTYYIMTEYVISHPSFILGKCVLYRVKPQLAFTKRLTQILGMWLVEMFISNIHMPKIYFNRFDNIVIPVAKVIMSWRLWGQISWITLHYIKISWLICCVAYVWVFSQVWICVGYAHTLLIIQVCSHMRT